MTGGCWQGALRPERETVHLFLTRGIRRFAYGAIAVIFFLYFKLEFSSSDITGILVGVFLGEWATTLLLTMTGDRIGRRRALLLSSTLMFLLGITFFLSSNTILVAFAGVIGIVSPSGGDMGTFAAVEQAIMSDTLARRTAFLKAAAAEANHNGSAVDETAASAEQQRQEAVTQFTRMLSWYQMIGSAAAAAGALTCGFAVALMTDHYGFTEGEAYRGIYLGYAGSAFAIALLYATLPSIVDVPFQSHRPPRRDTESAAGPAPQVMELPATATTAMSCCGGIKLGIHRRTTAKRVLALASLFFVDAFAGGLSMQSYMSWWFHVRWNFDHKLLGALLMGTNIIAACSGIFVSRIVKRFGPIPTMVGSHIPTNIMMVLIVFMPTAWSAAAMALLRCVLMNVYIPVRQAFTNTVVPSDERAAGNGITMSVRSLAIAVSVIAVVPMSASPSAMWQAAPFVISGGLKCFYDVGIFLVCPKLQAEADAESSRLTVRPPSTAIAGINAEGDVVDAAAPPSVNPPSRAAASPLTEASSLLRTAD